MTVLDAHQHFWTKQFFASRALPPGYDALVADFGPDDLRPLLDEAGVAETILVQTTSSYENTREFLAIAEQYHWIVGVVGWADLGSPRLDEELEEFAGHPKFKGVRHQWEDEPDPAWILRPEIIRGLHVLARRGIPYELLVRPKNWAHIPRVINAVPDLRLVIDHIGKPRIVERQFDDWAEMMRIAATTPRMHCKVSGMVTEADWATWRAEDLRPYVEKVLELFGTERVLYGSDWPVSVLGGTYTEVFSAIQDCLRSLSDGERAKVLGDSARAFYALL